MNKLKKIMKPVPEDIIVARSIALIPIAQLANHIGVLDSEFIPYGKYKGKVNISVLDRFKNKPNGNYVLVTGITPTKMGEGKSTTTVGISQALGAHLKKKVFTCIRQPSLGPILGVKGGAAGGGYSQVVPIEDFNLHLTGDIHATTTATNLLAAAIDSRHMHETISTDDQLFRRMFPKDKNGKRKFLRGMIARKNKLNITTDDPDEMTEEQKKKMVRLDIDNETITWKRVCDMNDRHLRKIEIGLNETEFGNKRETGYEITVASEVMSIHALSNDLQDMKDRIGKISCCKDKEGNLLTVDDFGATGAMTVCMKDTIHPTLMQTIEGTPAFVHGAPFANISIGQSSIIADKVALKLVGEDGYVLTEAGFGSDVGGAKFFNLKCRESGLQPNCVVITTTLRALRSHGGQKMVDSKKPDMKALTVGISQLGQHIENMKQFQTPVIVCLNQFESDTEEESNFVLSYAKDKCFAAVSSNHWAEGGKGAIEIAEKIIEACKVKSDPQPLYSLDKSLKEKMLIVAQKVYGAKDVAYSQKAEEVLQDLEERGLGNLPICVAKTQYSFSHDPRLKGAPKDYTFEVTDARAFTGSGFVVLYAGAISAMPGLGTKANYMDMDIDCKTGEISGLF